MRRIDHKEYEAALAKIWNVRCSQGTPVVYRNDDGSELVTRTRSEAWLTGSGTAIVCIEGKSGGVHLLRVTPLQ